jgi:DNA-binding transcriptional ArsR family regulator
MPPAAVNHMVEEKMTRLAEDDRLDDVFHALSNRTRRALLRSLAAGRRGSLSWPSRIGCR